MEGFMFLKQLVLEKGFETIFLENNKMKQLIEEEKIKVLDCKTNSYKISAILEIDKKPIKIEI